MSGSLFDQYKSALRRGHLAALAGDLAGALDAYRLAARLVPERALPFASQGTVLHRLDRWPEAAAAFERALEMAPDDEAALRARAQARNERGLRSGAAADYERLAFVLDVAGRSADAAVAARRASDLGPSTARDALALRLAAAAAQLADLMPAPSTPTGGPEPEPAVETAPTPEPAAAEPEPAPESQRHAEVEPAKTEPAAEAGAGVEDGLDEPPRTAADIALAARIAELGTQPAWVDMDGRAVGSREGGEGGSWPGVDLPSPPPPPLEGPPPDPETLVGEAAALVAAGDAATARDRLLVAIMVHRADGRLDAALEVALQLLTIAPGDPQVHLAIANLQLDRGWTEVATEKIELLLRLTALTGDTQAEADVHYLASERLRDDALSTAGHR